MDLQKYIERVSVEPSPELQLAQDFLSEISAVTVGARNAQLNGTDLERLFCYRVPTLKADGCSSVDGSLEAAPYDLRQALGVTDVADIREHDVTRQLFVLDRLVEHVRDALSVDWLGFYQRRSFAGGDEVLVKLSYRGVESRAEFPLTSSFAARSNNSLVGMTGAGVVINDVESYLWEQGGPYYQCDGKVLSEVCLPVFSVDGQQVIGILDCESWERDKFSPAEVSKLFAAAVILTSLLAPIATSS